MLNIFGEKNCLFNVHSLRVSLCIYFTLIAGDPAWSQETLPFYSNKKITLIVGWGPGALYDTTARLIGRYMGRHLNGSPSIVVQNMPGAGSRTATNHIYNIAPRDGTVLGVIGRGMAIEPLMGVAAARFDAQQLNWLGSTSSEVSTCAAWHNATVQKLENLYTSELYVGSTGGDDEIFPKMLNTLIGTKFKVIAGYQTGLDINLAMERGEIGGRCGWSWGSIKSRSSDWLQGNKISILLQLGLDKAPDLPNVPAIMENVKSEEDRQVLELLVAPQKMAWPLVAPPGLSKLRIEELRHSFDATMSDPEFLADAERIKYEVNPVRGEDIQRLVARIHDFPASIVTRAKTIAYPQN